MLKPCDSFLIKLFFNFYLNWLSIIISIFHFYCCFVLWFCLLLPCDRVFVQTSERSNDLKTLLLLLISLQIYVLICYWINNKSSQSLILIEMFEKQQNRKIASNQIEYYRIGTKCKNCMICILKTYIFCCCFFNYFLILLNFLVVAVFINYFMYVRTYFRFLLNVSDWTGIVVIFNTQYQWV